LPYQVPMIEVSATVALAGLEPEEHFLYLAPYSERRDGPESVEDYVNGRRRFFPMVSEGVPKIVNRDQVMWLRHERLPTVVEAEVTIVESLTIIELVDGTRFEGTVPIDRPREQSRLSDVLNDPAQQFIRMDDDTETYFINKTFIRRVIPR
jgi:hypothetical protein